MEWTRTQTTLPGANGTTVNNPLYQAGYTPRYYTVNAGDPVYLFVGSGAYFDPVMKSWLGKEHLGNWNDPTTYMTLNPTDPSYASAVISPLSPTSNWLNTSELYAMWNQMETEYGGQAFEIDSMLYTNNSIMSLARKSSAWRGQMVVNGGIVAADTGILVPGPDKLTVGLNMNYDARLARAFDLRTDEGVTLVRLLSH